MKYSSFAVLMLLVFFAGCSTKITKPIESKQIVFGFGEETLIDFSSVFVAEDKALQVRFEKSQDGKSVIVNVAYLPKSEFDVFYYSFGGQKKSFVFKDYLIEVFGSVEVSFFKVSKSPLEEVPMVFYLSQPFFVEEGKTYSLLDKALEISSIKFLDSRCPSGSVCVWEGELGLEFLVKGFDEFSEQWSEKIYLGEKTSKSKSFLSYEVKLLEIGEKEGKKFASLVVDSEVVGGKAWFSIEPRQCQTNAWDYPNWAVKDSFRKEEERIKAWLEQVHNIKVYDFASKRSADAVCAACSCPSGIIVAVLVDSFNSGKLVSLGFQPMKEINCTLEAKACPGGGFVGRVAPFCDFEPCKNNYNYDEKVFCAADVFECPDGSFVARVPPTCEFAPCPNKLR